MKLFQIIGIVLAAICVASVIYDAIRQKRNDDDT